VDLRLEGSLTGFAAAHGNRTTELVAASVGHRVLALDVHTGVDPDAGARREADRFGRGDAHAP
jgi:hypothetical protein